MVLVLQYMTRSGLEVVPAWSHKPNYGGSSPSSATKIIWSQNALRSNLCEMLEYTLNRQAELTVIEAQPISIGNVV